MLPITQFFNFVVLRVAFFVSLILIPCVTHRQLIMLLTSYAVISFRFLPSLPSLLRSLLLQPSAIKSSFIKYNSFSFFFFHKLQSYTCYFCTSFAFLGILFSKLSFLCHDFLCSLFDCPCAIPIVMCSPNAHCTC